MKIDYTENGDLEFNSKNYNILKNGIVIFPETLEEADRVKEIKEELEQKFKIH